MIRLARFVPMALILLVLTGGLDSANACVGRKLVLGSLEDERQGMVSRILSVLIHERTGTTVEVKYFSTPADLRQAVTKGKVDLFVGYVDPAMRRLEESGSGVSAEDSYRLVKRRFDEEFNLIWLKPMGFSGRDGGGQDLGQAAVVVRKEALKKFPALPRLLEKVGTKVVLDDGLLDSLVLRGREKKPARVARDFLKQEKLI